MGSWLHYTAAFAVGLAATAAVYTLTAFVVMQGPMSLSVAAFVGFVFILPILAGLVAFGFAYPKIAGDTLSGSDRLNAFAFTMVATIFFSSLVLSRMVPAQFAFPAFVIVLFFGGRILLMRRNRG